MDRRLASNLVSKNAKPSECDVFTYFLFTFKHSKHDNFFFFSIFFPPVATIRLNFGLSNYSFTVFSSCVVFGV